MTDSRDPHPLNQMADIRERIGDIRERIGAMGERQNGLESRLTGLERDIKERLGEMRVGQDEVLEKLGQLIEDQAHMKGGWKAITILGGLVVTLGGVVAWVADKWLTMKGGA